MATKKALPNAIVFDDTKWRAEEDMRTLARAKEIEADRVRMAAAKRVATQKIKEMQSIVSRKPVASKPAAVKTTRK